MHPELENSSAHDEKYQKNISFIKNYKHHESNISMNKTIVYSSKKITSKSMIMHPTISTSLEYAKRIKSSSKQSIQSPKRNHLKVKEEKSNSLSKFIFSNKKIQVKMKQVQQEEYLRNKIEHLKLYCPLKETEFNKFLQLKKKKHYKIRNRQFKLF